MNRHYTPFAICVLCLSLPSQAFAQAERYELGRRLGAFELAWDKYTDPQARKKACAHLWSLPLQTIMGQTDESARAFDAARHALMGDKEIPADTQWAESLYLVPATRLLDASATEFPFMIREFYKTQAPLPKDARLGLALLAGAGKPFQVAITQVPLAGNMPLQGAKEGDHLVHLTIRAGDRTLAQTLFKVSLVKDLKPRLEKLRRAVSDFGRKTGTADQETVAGICSLLEFLADGQPAEIDYPAARLLAEAEAAIEAIKSGKRFYGGEKTGQFWLRLPQTKSTVAVRMLAPDAVLEKKPLPLVIAMHGMGASENFFFEAYGSGLAAKLCRERGWLLVAPRGGLLSHDSPSEIIDEVAKLYPVDKSKVFIVGHGIGASHAVTAVQQTPKRFGAVAFLSSGGSVKPKSDLRNVPFFVGVGSMDLAHLPARNLAEKLKKAGAGPVEFREYADIEHLVIVREALPDAFALFDKVVFNKRGL